MCCPAGISARPGAAWTALLAVALAACGDTRLPELELGGASMGTTYGVRLVAPPAELDDSELYADIEALLAGIEGSMSTYDPDSELSIFNATRSTDWMNTSAELCAVVAGALAISRQTTGAFDVTVGPLVNLWGFGPDGPAGRPPDAASIAAARRSVGYDLLETDCSVPALRKKVPDLYVDLSAYAKGHAVDRVAELLSERGIENYMVEIGGELRLRGTNAAGEPWHIAVEKPVTDRRSVEAILALTDAALATSGDYRNYVEFEGTRYSHAVDPRTGYPVSHGAASVTIVAATAAFADAMATALLVLGPEEGIRLAEDRNIAAYILIRGADGFEALASGPFASAGYLQ